MKIRVIHFDKEGFHRKALEEFQKKYGWDIENTSPMPEPPLHIIPPIFFRQVGDPIVRYWFQKFKEIEDSIKREDFVKSTECLYLSSCLTTQGDIVHIVSDLNGENIKKIPNVDCKIIEG